MRNLKLHRELHRVIESAIAKKAKQVQRWREDHITLAWLEELEDSAVFSAPAAGPLDIQMAAWKLSGRPENVCGDVAVIARIRHPQTASYYQGARFSWRTGCANCKTVAPTDALGRLDEVRGVTPLGAPRPVATAAPGDRRPPRRHQTRPRGRRFAPPRTAPCCHEGKLATARLLSRSRAHTRAGIDLG
jgi:hypothetical protein